MSDELPKGWATTPIGGICEIIGGSQPPKTNFAYEPRTGYVRFIQIRDYKSDNHLTYIPSQLARRFCTKDDVMIGRYGPPLFQILRGIQGAYNVALMKAVPISGEVLDRDFLFYQLQNPPLRNYIIQSSERTVGQDGVRKDLLEAYEVALPPVGEQRRIVAKLEKLLGKVDGCQQRLVKIPALLKRFRQSVLTAACSGRLTADWCREGREATAITEIPDTDYKVPSSWKSVALGELSKFIDYRGRTPKKVDSGIPLITAKNIRQGYIDREPREFIRKEDYDSWMTRGIPRLGDVLITTEAPLGYVAAIDITEKFALAQRAICLQFHDPRNQDFALVYMMSPVFQGMLTEQSTGTTVSGIKASRLKQLRLLLPPPAEQKEIVRRVKGLFALAEEIETRYEKARTQVDKLTPSLLARAFRGELLPQDPNDEPASALLERIWQQQNGKKDNNYAETKTKRTNSPRSRRSTSRSR